MSISTVDVPFNRCTLRHKNDIAIGTTFIYTGLTCIASGEISAYLASLCNVDPILIGLSSLSLGDSTPYGESTVSSCSAINLNNVLFYVPGK